MTLVGQHQESSRIAKKANQSRATGTASINPVLLLIGGVSPKNAFLFEPSVGQGIVVSPLQPQPLIGNTFCAERCNPRRQTRYHLIAHESRDHHRAAVQGARWLIAGRYSRWAPTNRVGRIEGGGTRRGDVSVRRYLRASKIVHTTVVTAGRKRHIHRLRQVDEG